jgi:hypothetical protein
MKPFYKSKKFWTAVMTAIATVLAYIYKDGQLATLMTTVGAVLIAGFGLEDHGKASAALGIEHAREAADEDEEEEEEEDEEEE